MIENIKSKHTDYLFKAIMSLENIEEFYKFFDDLCTVAEIEDMSNRLQAAKMLRSGEIYSEISAKTGQSTATISRVKRCLKYGSNGYNIVLNRIEGREDERNEKGEKNGKNGKDG